MSFCTGRSTVQSWGGWVRGGWRGSLVLSTLFEGADCWLLLIRSLADSREEISSFLSIETTLILFVSSLPSWPRRVSYMLKGYKHLIHEYVSLQINVLQYKSWFGQISVKAISELLFSKTKIKHNHITTNSTTSLCRPHNLLCSLWNKSLKSLFNKNLTLAL